MTLSYTNPVWPGYLADPFALKIGDLYYAVGTGGPENHGLQPDGRMFPLLRSSDLVHWEYLGGALKPLNDPMKPSYWAPEIAERDGRFYMYYSAGGSEGEGHQLRVAMADAMEDAFVDTGAVLMPDEPFTIDASPFRDPRDGRWYLFFAKDYFEGDFPGTGAAVVALRDDMLGVEGEVRTVVRASDAWQLYKENRHWYERDWKAWYTVEGPFTLYRNGRYYCLYSGGRWETVDYGVGYVVADHPLGPYKPEASSHGPSVLRGLPGEVLGPGHNSIVVGPVGETDFMVYHAWDSGQTMRRLCIDPLRWTDAGPRCDGPSIGKRELTL
jgi:arabinan endo-1,5-alpha-L-arabinosidase